jgi:HD-GYP domain-containing protein (c-di-GMP phosphodiesterase class II)
MIADTLDAITSDRPYRPAATFAQARAEIARCAGTQFDPRCAEAFAAISEDELRALLSGE